jgi:hypothetical protein
MLQLPDEIGLPHSRDVVPRMAAVARRHPRLNFLNLEAVASAHVLQATIWLSPETASGILPGILESEGLDWKRLGRLELMMPSGRQDEPALPGTFVRATDCPVP